MWTRAGKPGKKKIKVDRQGQASNYSTIASSPLLSKVQTGVETEF